MIDLNSVVTIRAKFEVQNVNEVEIFRIEGKSIGAENDVWLMFMALLPSDKIDFMPYSRLLVCQVSFEKSEFKIDSCDDIIDQLESDQDLQSSIELDFEIGLQSPRVGSNSFGLNLNILGLKGMFGERQSFFFEFEFTLKVESLTDKLAQKTLTKVKLNQIKLIKKRPYLDHLGFHTVINSGILQIDFGSNGKDKLINSVVFHEPMSPFAI